MNGAAKGDCVSCFKYIRQYEEWAYVWVNLTGHPKLKKIRGYIHRMCLPENKQLKQEKGESSRTV
jgi:hypothetical protein